VGNMYPPHHFGGYELAWQGAMRHLREAGHAVRVLTTDLRTSTTEPDDPETHRELRWYWRDGGFPRIGYGERVSLERHNARVLERHLDDLRPDLVTWWSMGGMSLSLIERVSRRGIRSAAFLLDDWLDYGRHADGWMAPFGRFRRTGALAERLFRVPTSVDFGAVDHWVFVSERTRRHALGLGLPLRSPSVAPCGIDPAFLDQAPAQPWQWRLLYVGRIDPRKGVETAIDALDRLPEEAVLTVVGGGDEREEARLRRRAAQTRLDDRVRFEGQHERDALIAYYGAADAVVFPVIWEEPWGMVPLEAMGRGRPVVGTGRGGSGEYLREGHNSLLFEAGDPADLARRLSELAADPHLRERLRAGGLQTAPRHTQPVYNAAVEDVVDQVGRLGGLTARGPRRRGPRAPSRA
jgi:glycogen synthase